LPPWGRGVPGLEQLGEIGSLGPEARHFPIEDGQPDTRPVAVDPEVLGDEVAVNESPFRVEYGADFRIHDRFQIRVACAHGDEIGIGSELDEICIVVESGTHGRVVFALTMVFFRATYVDFWGVVLCVALMSISSLFYIIGGQFLISKLWHLVPISGYGYGFDATKFLILPVIIGVVSGAGGNTRWYRTIFLEEMSKDYVRTARAKGLSENVVLFGHVLRNALIPILTGTVVVIPLLFLGSLIAESFFGIPGLGSYTIDAINSQDFAVVRAMVFLGSLLYIVGLILTDISYTLVDPRIRLE